MKTEKRNSKKNISSQTQKRKPIVSALLSFLSLGIGQIYNGELLKGILLKFALFFALASYMFLNLKTAKGLFFLTALIILFFVMKVYSIIQAFIKFRQHGSVYTLKWFNKSYVYLVAMIGFIALNLSPLLILPNWMLIEHNSYHPFRSEKAKSRYLRLYDSIGEDWPVESETRMIDTAYGQTHVRISGQDQNPPLVLLPGSGTASLMWGPNIESLSASFRTFAVDSIYDFGKSVFTRAMKSPDDTVRWLDELFDGLGLEDNIHLMGLSYGGWMASQYGLQHQDRLKKIVLLAPAATVADFSWGFIIRGIRLWVWPYKSSYRKFLAWALGDLDRIGERGLEFIEEETALEFLAMRSFKPKMPVTPTVLREEDWKNIEVPVLYMVGDQEVIYSLPAADVVKRLNSVAPEIETELIPNAGHGFSSLQADLVNRKVLEFLKKE